MATSEYGHRGGTSATAGKSAEVLRSPSTGLTKRVFKGQRWLVVSQRDEASRCTICAFTTADRAKRCSDNTGKLGYDVHYVEQAEVLSA